MPNPVPKNKWFTSSRSTGNDPACVEVFFHDGGVYVRDTKNRESGQLSVGATSWETIVTLGKQGHLDLPA